MPTVCFVPGCKTGYRTDREKKKSRGETVESLYQPPKDPDLLEKWKRAILREDKDLKPTDFVCALHFRKDDIQDYYEVKLADGTVWKEKKGRSGLRKGAVPCFFPNLPAYLSKNKVKRKQPTERNVALVKKSKIPIDTSTSLKNDLEEPKEVLLSSKEIENFIGNLANYQPSAIDKCSVPQSELFTYVKTKFLGETPVQSPQPISRDNLSVAPQVISPQNIDKENLSIQSQLNPMVTLAQVIFTQENSSEPQEINTDLDLEDNSADELEVVFPHPQGIITDPDLDDNSADEPEVVFPHSQGIISDPDLDDNSADEPEVIFPHPQGIITDPDLEDDSVDESEVVFPQSVLNEQFSFNFIKVNINMIDKQNSMWTINLLDTYIIFTRWSSDCVLERKIVIKDDLTVKVFLKEKPTTLGNDLKLVSLETISKLIYRVEKTQICPEICNNEGKCYGFLQGIFICKKKNLCEGCIKWEKEKALEEKRRLLEEKRIAQKQVELIRFHFNV